MASAILDALVNHVFLPPCLPGKSDAGLHGLAEAFVERLLKASLLLRNSGTGELFTRYDCIRIVLQTAKTLNAGAKVDKDTLLTAFQELNDKSFLILFIQEQNAGLLIRESNK